MPRPKPRRPAKAQKDPGFHEECENPKCVHVDMYIYIYMYNYIMYMYVYIYMYTHIYIYKYCTSIQHIYINMNIYIYILYINTSIDTVLSYSITYSRSAGFCKSNHVLMPFALR